MLAVMTGNKGDENQNFEFVELKEEKTKKPGCLLNLIDGPNENWWVK